MSDCEICDQLTEGLPHAWKIHLFAVSANDLETWYHKATELENLMNKSKPQHHYKPRTLALNQETAAPKSKKS